eukprot:GILI01033855.1.p1 GENE.GILI01033855.1~~GILI01033855.1.p1  ORF type:complete len:411 (+),score=54.81 GILI01033855.1:40-1233(+)
MLRANELLHKAALEGNLEAVKAHIQSGMDLNDNSGYGFYTPLHRAIERGNVEIALALMEGGCMVDKINRDGQRPLHLAALKGLTPVVKALIAAQCVVTACDSDGSTALHIAAKKGFPDIVDLLIEASYSLETRDLLGDTALILSISFRRPDISKRLIAAGSDVNAGSEKGMPLMLALGQPDVLIALLDSQRCNFNVANAEGNTALHVAASNGWIEALKVLTTTKGCNINAFNSRGQSALYVAAFLTSAAKEVSFAMVRLLVDAGCSQHFSPTVCDPSLLHCACSFGRPDLVAYFLELGHDVVSRDSQGCTPLQTATACNSPAIVKLLLMAGAELESSPKSLLQVACKYRFNAIAQTFLDFGCDWEEADRSITADGALGSKTSDTRRLLAREGAYVLA